MKMKYEDLKKANEAIKTTPIQGKEYAEVHQRIKAFRMVCPDGYIKTEILSLEGGVCIVKAEVGIGEGILGTGHAYEKEGSNYINKTSYIENCETSAVGRALGMAGFGIDVAVASADEMTNAITNQTITDGQLKTIRTMLQVSGAEMDMFLTYLGVDRLEDMTVSQFARVVPMLQKKMDNAEAERRAQ